MFHLPEDGDEKYILHPRGDIAGYIIVFTKEILIKLGNTPCTSAAIKLI